MERFEIEESAGFLPGHWNASLRLKWYRCCRPVQALEGVKTRLHAPATNTHFSYNRVPWKLKIR
jgi:hypothetical protein